MDAQTIFNLPVFSNLLNFVIPFLLIFALLYALFTKTEYVSERKSVNSVIAFSIALITALSAGEFLMKLAPFFATFLIIIFGVFILLAFLGYRVESFSKSKPIMISLVIAAVIFTSTTAWLVYKAPLQETGEEIINKTTENRTKYEEVDYEKEMDLPLLVSMISHPKMVGMLIVIGVLIGIVSFFSFRH